jgi:hypothetical protein
MKEIPHQPIPDPRIFLVYLIVIIISVFPGLLLILLKYWLE